MVSQETPSAEEQAESLLLQHLTPEQQETYKAEGWFEFKGSRGNLFRLYRREALVKRSLYMQGRLVRMNYDNGKPTRFLAHNVWITDRTRRDYAPEAAILLSFKILIELREGNTEIGCTTYHDREVLLQPG